MIGNARDEMETRFARWRGRSVGTRLLLAFTTLFAIATGCVTSPDGSARMTPNEMFRLMTAHVAQMHDAVSRNLFLPIGLSPNETCRIQIVQGSDGAVRSVDVLECDAKSFETAVREAVARTSLPAPLQFPHDPPLAQTTVMLEFTPKHGTTRRRAS